MDNKSEETIEFERKFNMLLDTYDVDSQVLSNDNATKAVELINTNYNKNLPRRETMENVDWFEVYLFAVIFLCFYAKLGEEKKKAALKYNFKEQKEDKMSDEDILDIANENLSFFLEVYVKKKDESICIFLSNMSSLCKEACARSGFRFKSRKIEISEGLPDYEGHIFHFRTLGRKYDAICLWQSPHFNKERVDVFLFFLGCFFVKRYNYQVLFGTVSNDVAKNKCAVDFVTERISNAIKIRGGAELSVIFGILKNYFGLDKWLSESSKYKKIKEKCLLIEKKYELQCPKYIQRS